MSYLLAQQVNRFANWGLGEMLIAVVVVAACIALVYVALRHFGIAIPPFVVQCFWIVLGAIVVIFCLRFVLSL